MPMPDIEKWNQHLITHRKVQKKVLKNYLKPVTLSEAKGLAD